MAGASPLVEIPHSAPDLRLLVELPSRPQVFLSNLRDLLFPRHQPALELQSAPAQFWPDVFVRRKLPWRYFAESVVYHVLACATLLTLGHIFALQPRVTPTQAFDHSQVIYYRASEYLPPLDTRSPSAEPPRRADSEASRQPIISVPREADNRSQTIVAPPEIKLKSDVPMRNIVAWSDKVIKPRLAIPDAPLSPAAEITRIAPTLQQHVAVPPQDATAAHRRNLPTLQDPVAAPPRDLNMRSPVAVQGLQPTLTAPPSDIANSPSRRAGTMNIAPSDVIAPAPQLAVFDQRAVTGGRKASLGGPQVVAPPPALNASGGTGGTSGAPGRLIALNLHPSVDAPPDPPAGNRRGTFAATPEGRPGASGASGSLSGNMGSGSPTGGGKNSNGSGGAQTNKVTEGAPAGLYVASAPKPGAVSGDPSARATPAVSPALIASVHPPRVSTARPMQPDSAAKLSEPERTVFGGRRFYSVTLNMPNLNSAGGSWVIRFAELKHDLTSKDANATTEDLSQPMATRKVDPAYPMQLMRENVHGTVILYAVIHADGSVGDVRILRGVDERLDRFATEAVRQWKFEPATKNGVPVDVEATFQIPFRPARIGTNF